MPRKPHTIHSYRDSLTLLLRFMTTRYQRPVAILDIDDIDAERVIAFLQHLEDQRGNTSSTLRVRTNSSIPLNIRERLSGYRNPDRPAALLAHQRVQWGRENATQ